MKRYLEFIKENIDESADSEHVAQFIYDVRFHDGDGYDAYMNIERYHPEDFNDDGQWQTKMKAVSDRVQEHLGTTEDLCISIGQMI